VEKIDFGYLAGHAHTLRYKDTQGYWGELWRERGSTQSWKRFCQKAGQRSDIEAWAAFVHGSLAAFTVTLHVEDYLQLYIGESASRFLRYYPNNALLFTIVKSKLRTPGIRYVSFGTKPLAAGPGLDHFKRSMGFTIRPCKERVVLNPLLRPVLLAGNRLVKRIAKRYPQNQFWQMASETLILSEPA
jgi:hypothetical protein